VWTSIVYTIEPVRKKGACNYLKSNKLVSLLLIIVLVLSVFSVASAADNIPAAKVVFKASEPDANGMFTATLTVYNATFNAFQFAFSYNKDVVSPVNSTGATATNFSDFGKMDPQASSRLETLGNNLDTGKGLMECGGYAKPGSGSITADASGLVLYTFTFKKTGSGDAAIKLATESSGGPFNPSIKEGGGLAEGGYNVDTTVEIKLPKALGDSLVDKIVAPSSSSSSSPENNPNLEDPKAIRLKNTVILQISNGVAAKDGILTRVDNESELVVPYIDENNRTMVPVRFIAESLGAVVGWDPVNRQVTITLNGKIIKMMIGSKEYSINNVSGTMDTSPVINKGWNRTMVPGRFVAEALGMDVMWDPINQFVVISPLSNPWNPDGSTEKDIYKDMQLLFSPLMRDFI